MVETKYKNVYQELIKDKSFVDNLDLYKNMINNVRKKYGFREIINFKKRLGGV